MSELFSFMDKAPEVLKNHAAAAGLAFQRLKKAEVQLSLWTEELKTAKELHQAQLNSFNDLLRRWDPETQNISMPESLPLADIATQLTETSRERRAR